MHSKYIVVLLVLLLAGCASTSAPKIVTDGYHDRLPAAGTVAQFPSLWPGKGRSSTYPFKEEEYARDAAVQWLRKRGVKMIVPVDERQQLVREQRFGLQQTDTGAEPGRLQAASLMIEIRMDSGAVREPAVTITGVDVSTGEIVWSGSSRMPPLKYAERRLVNGFGEQETTYVTKSRLDAHTVALLTCHALRTAFGLQPPGAFPVDLEQGCER